MLTSAVLASVHIPPYVEAVLLEFEGGEKSLDCSEHLNNMVSRWQYGLYIH